MVEEPCPQIAGIGGMGGRSQPPHHAFRTAGACRICSGVEQNAHEIRPTALLGGEVEETAFGSTIVVEIDADVAPVT